MPTERDPTVPAAAHPLVLGAAASVLLNDFVLRGNAPDWLTGKLSDVGWLIVAPVVAAALLVTSGVPGRWARPAGLLVAGAFYVTLQVWPPLGRWFSPAHVADVGDLLVLPALGGAILAWQRARPTRWGFVALPLLGAALAADTPAASGEHNSWPCGDGEMTWDAGAPLRVGFEYAEGGGGGFVDAMRLTEEGTGEEVPFVFAWTGSVGLVCARDGLRGDTDYAWELPWETLPTDAYGPTRRQVVRFHTTAKDGPTVEDESDCFALLADLDEETEGMCHGGEYRGPDDTGDTGS